jgi:hypothetical protein
LVDTEAVVEVCHAYEWEPILEGSL